MDLNTKAKKYTDDEIKELWKLYKNGLPYIQGDLENIAFDSFPYEENRLGATIAKEILIELGLLEDNN